MAPRPHPGWTGVRPATGFGPGCPQLPRLIEAGTLGQPRFPPRFPQDEDCLYLNIWSPELEPARSPVLFWIHGGAFTNGSSSLPWYNGLRLASAGRMVVVTVNYRLGPLGFLYAPGTGDSNAGLRDQLAALAWVRENIAAFGGDPDNITVAGQSAGALSAIALLTAPAAQGLFRRVIAQSPNLGDGPLSRGEAAWNTHQYLELLGLRPSAVRELRRLPAARLLAAARDLEQREARFFNPHMVFQLVTDGETLASPPLEALAAGGQNKADVLIGSNRDEMAAFHQGDKRVLGIGREGVLERYRPVFFEEADAVYRQYAAARPGATPGQILMDLGGDELFRMPSLRLAELREAAGHPAYVYQFDWQSPAPGFGACHGLELPFVFDNFAEWKGAPMLKGLQRNRVALLARAIQQAWIAFVRNGDPNHAEIPHWEPYTTARRTTLRIDTALEAVGDLAGAAKRARWIRATRPAQAAGGSRAA